MSGGGLIETVRQNNMTEETSPINYTPVRLVILLTSRPAFLPIEEPPLVNGLWKRGEEERGRGQRRSWLIN